MNAWFFRSIRARARNDRSRGNAFRWDRVATLAFALLAPLSSDAQSVPGLAIQRLTNGEVALRLSAPVGLNYRVDVATRLPQWEALVTLQSTGTTTVHIDSGAPYASSRFYRAEQLAGPGVFTGDHLVTTNGDVVFHPINHASLVLTWNGKTIYNDPVGGATPYAGLPRADLILVSHEHPDHYNSATLDAVRGNNCTILAPQAVYAALPTTLRALAGVLTNGVSTNLLGLNVEAVPAYNTNHTRGTGNGYLLTLGGKRVYFSGDTGNTTEMRALHEIDVAFLCMNVPFTMNITDATNAVRAFRPKVVYPYHYRDQGSTTTTNAASFKARLGQDLGIEVRLRKWY